MITSIFSKSRLINFIIVFFIALIAFSDARAGLIKEAITTSFVFKQLVLFGICYSSILLLNFIVSKNNLTNKNNYEILLFSLFLLMITQSISHVNIILSNFFVMLGLRRILSLRSQINVKKKLFDAAFWITIAALFYFWSILFFILILISLFLYSETKINHWIIPFTGVIAVFLMNISVSIIFNNSFFGFFKSFPEVSYDLSNYNSTQYLVAITLLLSFGIWSSIFCVKSIKQKKKAFRASFNAILFACIIALVIVILAPHKSGSEFLFTFAPLSIIITNYIEIIEEKWFKEVFLSVLILVPFVLLFL